jgi:Flp pilus assembly protein TadG
VIGRIGRAARREEGAAAVEFALLLPIFVMLTFGVISTGIALWKHISDVQAARDAARYGSTLPLVATGPSNCDATNLGRAGWLTCVQSVAVREANWPNVAAVSAASDGGYVCVAYVQGTGAGGTVTSSRLEAGTHTSDDPALPSNMCFDDSRTDGRVQVYIRRIGSFDAILYARKWNMNTRISIPYERGTP